MTRFLSLSALLLIAFLIASGCGGSSNQQLQSIAISPASADANHYSNGLVPFTALGTFNKPPSPSPLSSKEVTWCYGGTATQANLTAGICAGNIAQFATVDSNGVAQCNAQFVGSAIILAGIPSSSVVNPDGGPQLKIFGSAVLTCP